MSDVDYAYDRYSILGGTRSLSVLVQSLDCKNGVELTAGAGSGEIVAYVFGNPPSGLVTVALRELADIDARDQAMDALDNAPSMPTYRAAAKRLFKDVAAQGGCVARKLADRYFEKTEVDAVAVMFDGPRFMMHLPAGTDVRDWMDRPGALEALKKEMREAVDEADLDCFDVCETFEEKAPSCRVTHLA